MFYFVTGNKNKFKEVREIFKPLKIKQASIHIDEIQSFNLNEICKAKVLQAYSRLKKPLFVEDVSLEINALNKFPGPFIKWVEETISNKGILKLLEGKTNRKAIAKAMVCFYDGKRLRFFQGILKGKIALKEKGKGWGFDPIFIPNGKNKTIAELGYKWKNKNSHRFKAHSALKKYLTTQESFCNS